MRFEAGAETADELDGEPALAAAVIECQTPAGFERIADGADRSPFGHLQDRPCDSREEMRVLVRVEMGDGDAGPLKFLNLCERFSDDVFLANAAQEKCSEKVG